mmetsp:Transcript_40947/g.107531  ORF Transcript_40947/g.107531 Transcript_40947/m.107531 type:complete len:498 (+) Transcript_40947:98-1591(+)
MRRSPYDGVSDCGYPRTDRRRGPGTPNSRRDAIRVAEAFDCVKLRDDHGAANGSNGRFVFAVTVPAAWNVGDVFAALNAISDVRSIDTVLVELFGIAIVTFFKIQSVAAVGAMHDVLGTDPVALGRADSINVHKLSASVVMGPVESWPFSRVAAACDQFGSCTGLRVRDGFTVADFPDSRCALQCRWALGKKPGITQPSQPSARVESGSSRTSDESCPNSGGSLTVEPARVAGEDEMTTDLTQSDDVRCNDHSADDHGDRGDPMSAQSQKIDVAAIRSSADTRTTCVIQNIPREWTREFLTELLDQVVRDQYDCLVLPSLPLQDGNEDFGFLNFKTASAIVPFYEAFHNFQIEQSSQQLNVQYSKVQGSRKVSKVWGRLDLGSRRASRGGEARPAADRGGTSSGGSRLQSCSTESGPWAQTSSSGGGGFRGAHPNRPQGATPNSGPGLVQQSQGAAVNQASQRTAAQQDGVRDDAGVRGLVRGVGSEAGGSENWPAG